MVNKFRAFIYGKNLFTENTPVLLAISGGIDSVVMADLFARTNLHFAIAHCNFKLRGKESEGDEAFVQQLAGKYQVSYFTKSFETVQYAKERRISIEMAARALRYEWFDELLNQEKYEYVATAHHRNDVMETLIFNLSRGTGIAGLHGIPTKNEKIIRPLLFADRRQIETYAKENQLNWREDRSNHDEKYRRNLIRKKVVPVLEEINPNLLQTLELSLERISATEEVFMAVVSDFRKVDVRSLGKDTFINIKGLKKQVGMNVVLHELIKPFGFQYHQTREIAELLRQEDQARQIGKVFDSATHRLNIDREELIISSLSEPPADSYTITEKENALQTNDFEFTIFISDASKYKILSLANVAALDYALLKFPLLLRKWKVGDFFYPLGMNRKKKLSDFMIDLKIPLNLKDSVMVLTSGEDIVWVVGHRIDHRYRVTRATQQVYEITRHVK